MFTMSLSRLRRRGLTDVDAALLVENGIILPEVAAQADICTQDCLTSNIHLIEAGWACRYRLMSDGRRQIVSVHLPGDICDLDKLFHSCVPYGISAVAQCRVVALPIEWVRAACAERQSLRDALWHLSADEYARSLEQIVSLGRRTARERMAYFLCELLGRLERLDLAPAQSFRSPLTQSDIADLVGLSTVHVNRTLQHLRDEGLIRTRGRSYAIIKRDALERVAGFSTGTTRMSAQTTPTFFRQDADAHA